MSSEERLKRLGLDHLKNNPQALKEALEKAVQKNTRQELVNTLAQFEALKKLQNTPEDQAILDRKIEILKEQIKNLEDSSGNESNKEKRGEGY